MTKDVAAQIGARLQPLVDALTDSYRAYAPLNEFVSRQAVEVASQALAAQAQKDMTVPHKLTSGWRPAPVVAGTQPQRSYTQRPHGAVGAHGGVREPVMGREEDIALRGGLAKGVARLTDPNALAHLTVLDVQRVQGELFAGTPHADPPDGLYPRVQGQVPLGHQPTVTAELLGTIMASTHRKATAGGVSAVTPDTWQEVCIAHPPLRVSLAELFTLVVRVGYVPRAWRTHRVLFFEKPHGGLRPIAVGEWLGRLFERALTAVLEPLVTPNLFEGQIGIGVSDGVTQVADVASIVTHTGEFALVQLDVANGYGGISRVAILRGLAACGVPPVLVHAVEGVMRAWSMWFRPNGSYDPTGEHRIPFEDGVPQGSPLAALLFHAATNQFVASMDHALVRAVAVRAAGNPLPVPFTGATPLTTMATQLIDDITVHADDVQLVQGPLDQLVTEFAHIGLTLKHSKCSVAARGAALARARASPLMLRDTDGHTAAVRVVDLDATTVEVMGVPIGEPGGVLESLERLLAKACADADMLLTRWHTQLAWAAVRLCVSTRFNHLLRARDFPGAASALARYDDLMAETLLASVSVEAPYPPHVRRLLEARIGAGGMGMRSQADVAGHARAAALVAHATRGAPGLRGLVLEAIAVGLPPVAGPAARLRVLDITFAPGPMGAVEARRQGRRIVAGGLQHRLTREAEVAIDPATLPPDVAVVFRQRDAARCDALSQPPTPYTLVDNVAWTVQVAATVGANLMRHIEAVVGSSCPSCRAPMQPNHWCTCKLATSEITGRHNAVARVSAAYCGSGGNGALVRLEHVVPHPSGAPGHTQRPDVSITGFAVNGRLTNVHADVLVVDLFSRMANRSAQFGLALQQAEGRKRRERDPAARAQGARFVPLVATSHGHLGGEVYDLLRLMRGDRTDAEVKWWQRALVAAVWRGTGRVVAKYLARLGPLLPSHGATVPDIPAEA